MIFLALVRTYVLVCTYYKGPLKIWGWELPLPSFGLALAQIGLSSFDWMLAASVLYVLLPTIDTLSYPLFLGIFLLAQIMGVSSQVPGGLGVFETVVLLLLTPQLSPPTVLGALVVYRGIYYLLPLGVAAILLAAHELLQRKEAFRRLRQIFGRWVPALTPHLLALSTFISGAILVFSGATPAVHSRLAWLNNFLPLPVIELSHFLGSLAGVGLLLLARGLQQRLDVAYHLTVILLTAGIAFSLLKGLDYEEAIILTIMLAALEPCRAAFYRKASVVSQRFTPGWIAAIAVVLVGSIWL